ncbi:MAG: hypothetical protein M3295_06505, partial [Chloroflexota bacterium]|nr:hypothetical protein [Chloroflexota bacterium]
MSRRSTPLVAVIGLVATVAVVAAVVAGVWFVRAQESGHAAAAASPSGPTSPSSTAGIVLATPTPLATPQPLSATVEEDGIRVTLELERDAIGLGDHVWASVSVENIGTDAVIWGHSGSPSCAFPADVGARPPSQAPFEYGSTWGDNFDDGNDLDILKDVVVNTRYVSAYPFVPEPLLGPGSIDLCTADLRSDQLEPGDRLTVRAVWDGEGLEDGMPPPAGTYTVIASFEYFGRGEPGRSAFLSSSNKAVTAELPLIVDGPTRDLLSQGEAFDRIAMDPGFTAYFEEPPPGTWRGPSLTW